MKSEGNYRQDRAGIWHHDSMPGTHLDHAIADALATRPGPAWFWFNGTFAPIHPTDNLLSLHERWVLWRHAYQREPKELLRMLEGMPKEFEP